MTHMIDTIESKLRAAFAPSFLNIEDESHQHAGHAGAADHAAEFGDVPSHLHIAITSEALSPLSRLARHRALMDAIAEEVAQIHALRLTINGG